MKIVLLLLLVAGWVQLPAEGSLFKSHESRAKKSVEVESDEYYRTPCDPTLSSRFVRQMFKHFFDDEQWIMLRIGIASPEELQDVSFKKRFNVSDAQIKDVQDEIKSFDEWEAIYRNLQKFYSTKEWKCAMALSATSEELLDPAYRTRWGLGELSESVSDESSDGVEGDSFFCSPQWREAQEQDPEVFIYRYQDELMGMSAGHFLWKLLQSFRKLAEDDY